MFCLGPAKEHLHYRVYMQSFEWNFRYTKIHLYSLNAERISHYFECFEAVLTLLDSFTLNLSIYTRKEGGN